MLSFKFVFPLFLEMNLILVKIPLTSAFFFKLFYAFENLKI